MNFSEGGGNIPLLPINVTASANSFNRTATSRATDFGNINGLKRKKKTSEQTVLGRLHYLCRKYNVRNEQDFQALIFTSCESEDAEELLNIYSEQENITEYFVSLHNMLRQEDICLRIQRMDNGQSGWYKYYTDNESVLRLSEMCSVNGINVNVFVDNVMMLLRGHVSRLFIGGTYVSPIIDLLRSAVNEDVVSIHDNRSASLLIYYFESCSTVSIPDMCNSPMLVVCDKYREISPFFLFSDPSIARTTKRIHPSVLLKVYGRERNQLV